MKKSADVCNLRLGCFQLVELAAKFAGAWQCRQVPADVLAGYAHAHRHAVKAVQCRQVLEQDAFDFAQPRFGKVFAVQIAAYVVLVALALIPGISYGNTEEPAIVSFTVVASVAMIALLAVFNPFRDGVVGRDASVAG